MTDERDSIVNRCRKLSQMTIANGCSEAEAAFAAKKLAALMAEHNVSQSEYSIRRDAAQCLKDELVFMEDSISDWATVCLGIQDLYSTKAWMQNFYEDVLELGIPQKIVKVYYFGLPADVAASIAMTQICAAAINTESIAWGKENKLKGRGKALKLKSFRLGMAVRLKEIIRGLKPQVQTGTALVVLKNQLVTEEFAKLGMKLGKARSAGVADPTAYAAGQQRANSVRLGHASEVSGTRQIGHQ